MYPSKTRKWRAPGISGAGGPLFATPALQKKHSMPSAWRMHTSEPPEDPLVHDSLSVPSSKLLGFFVPHRGIEAPRTIKDVRRLTGCLAVPCRFISKSTKRALSFFKILKKAGPMKWTTEADAALQELQAYLSSVPTLVAPKPQ